MGHHTCTCICNCGCVHVCIHMHVCCPDGRGVALGKWWGSSIFVDQSQGQGSCSGPCSRWMEASDGSSLAGCSIPCWTPSANHHQPSSSSLLLFSLSVHRDLSWKCSSTGIQFVSRITPPSAYRHVHMLTHRRLCISRCTGSTHTLTPSTHTHSYPKSLRWPLNWCLSREQHPDHPKSVFVFLSPPADKRPHTTTGLWHTPNIF